MKQALDQRDFTRTHRLPAWKLQRQWIFPERILNVAERRTPGLPYCTIAPGERNVAQVSSSRVAGQIHDQELATPDSSIRTVTQAVKGNADHRPIETVLSHATHNVRMVVLNCDFVYTIQAGGVFGREIIGMKVMGDQRRLNIEKRFELLDGSDERLQRIVGFQVADMVA